MKPRKKVNKVETKTNKAEAKAPASASPKTAAAPAQKVEAAPAAAPARPSKIKVVKADTKYRGAREAWFNRLKEFDGKTEGEFLADTRERPPALTRNQTAENPTGWMRFFVRSGVATLQN